ncbi:MAG: pilus assembly protein N-terminal domain-containing protein [Zoogloeaceae bacterium]|jgi:pilus assembly protein CpaC|nr:pilus assembly protein N-terminal domain-containing protein [Zoogloeaceae bacterium]
MNAMMGIQGTNDMNSDIRNQETEMLERQAATLTAQVKNTGKHAHGSIRAAMLFFLAICVAMPLFAQQESAPLKKKATPVAQKNAEGAATLAQSYMADSRWQPPQNLEGSFHLYVGETRVVKLSSPAAKTAIGNGKIVSVAAVNENDLLIIANDAGRSTVHLWLKDGSEITYGVEVGLNSPAKTWAQVRDLLEKEENIKVSLIGNRVFLQAETLKSKQIPLVDALQKAFADQIVLVTGSDVALEERTVHVIAQLVEIRRSALERLGVQWDEGAPGPNFSVRGDISRRHDPSYVTPFWTTLSMASVISSRINLMRDQGDAYVVAEPRLTARCGGKANFTAGGELPISVVNGVGAANVQFKEYGVRLGIEPLCDKLGNIRAKVAAEVSQIDGSVTVMNIPGLLTRKAESELDLVDGQPMLLSGLASITARDRENRVPFLGRIPLLGHLFKSNETDGERSELVIIITPSFISSDGEVVRKGEERYKQLTRDTEEKLLDQNVKPLGWKAPPPVPFPGAPESPIDLRILWPDVSFQNGGGEPVLMEEGSATYYPRLPVKDGKAPSQPSPEDNPDALASQENSE